MTEEAKKQDQHKPEEEPKALIEDEVLPEEEPDHPGWLSIAEIMKISSGITIPAMSMCWPGIT